MKQISRKILVTVTLCLLISSCSLPGLVNTRSEDTIVVSGGTTTESQILAGMVKEIIEYYTDYSVEVINNLATTTITHQAMLKADLDISSTRYTGTDIASTLQMDPEKDPDKALALVIKEFSERYQQTWFPSWGFDNTYAFMVTQATADAYGLQTISDLVDIADQLNFGMDTSWMTRPGDGYPAFKEAYGFEIKNSFPMQVSLVYDAVLSGDVDIVLGYSTDGRIASYGLVLLEDNLNFFPPYDASLVVRNEVLAHFPELEAVLLKLAGTIDTDTMQRLNFESDDNLIEPTMVARNFLEEHNYFENEGDE